MSQTRIKIVKAALANSALEGLHPGEEQKRTLQKYEKGEISAKQGLEQAKIRHGLTRT